MIRMLKDDLGTVWGISVKSERLLKGIDGKPEVSNGTLFGGGATPLQACHRSQAHVIQPPGTLPSAALGASGLAIISASIVDRQN